VQPEKHPSPKTSIDAGRMISNKSVSLNASLSIRDNRELESNAIEESDVQPEKHHSAKNTTEPGILINLRLLF
jgi:hypothetical protein